MEPTTEINLECRPQLVNCGLVWHGLSGRENYEFPKLWCLHLYLYEVGAKIGRRTLRIMPGSVTAIPPGMRIYYEYHERWYRHFFVHFHAKSGPNTKRIPLHQHLPDRMDALLDRLRDIQRVWLQNAFHAEITLWSLLWDLVDMAETSGKSINQSSAFRNKVDETIENALPGDLPVPELASTLGMSPTHLNRRVKSEFGATTVQLIRRKRLHRACHLLIHSTMPIKKIAYEVGIGDLQRFNKMIHREYGKSPRDLRTDHS